MPVVHVDSIDGRHVVVGNQPRILIQLDKIEPFRLRVANGVIELNT